MRPMTTPVLLLALSSTGLACAGDHVQPKSASVHRSISEATAPAGATLAPGIADEPIACREPFAGHISASSASPADLRAVARRCSANAIGRLYYKRAYHAELMTDLRLMSQLRKGYAAADRMRLEQGRIYVALVEAFAVRAWAQQPSVIDEVNLAYDQSIRIAELTIGGYDLLVGAPAPAR